MLTLVDFETEKTNLLKNAYVETANDPADLEAALETRCVRCGHVGFECTSFAVPGWPGSLRALCVCHCCGFCFEL